MGLEWIHLEKMCRIEFLGVPLSETRNVPLGINITELFSKNSNEIDVAVLIEFLRQIETQIIQRDGRFQPVDLIVRDDRIGSLVVKRKIQSLFPVLEKKALIVCSRERQQFPGVFSLGDELDVKISPKFLARMHNSSGVTIAGLDHRVFFQDLPGTILFDLGEISRAIQNLISQLEGQRHIEQSA